MLTFIDFFAGVGGFRRGMELAGHKCIGFCEFDKFAVASYTAMHLMTDEDRERIAALPKKRRVAEAGKEEYRHGEWYANDVRRIFAGDIPKADCWCFGFPCQDISVAGKQAGLRGSRSSLFFRIMQLVNDLEEEDRPAYLFIENVRNLLSVSRGYDFLAVLVALDAVGYDAEWQVINSAGYVPQNRERVFIVGRLRGRSTRKIFPVEGTDGENTVSQIGNYLLTKTRKNPNQGRIYDPVGTAPCLNSMAGGGLEPSVILPAFCDMSYGAGLEISETASSLQARYNKGVCGRHGETSGVAVPVLTPDKVKKRQNGRRFKENGEPMYTLTAQDRQGVLVQVKEATKKGYADAGIGDSINLAAPESKTRRGRVGRGIANTLDTSCNQRVTVPVFANGLYLNAGEGFDRKPLEGVSRCLKANKHDAGVMVGLPDGGFAYAVWCEKYGCYVAIRRLTPKECFRLQGWEDVYFERAELVNSDSQLYKQAGNGVTAPVIRAIAERMDMGDEMHKEGCNGGGVPI